MFYSSSVLVVVFLCGTPFIFAQENLGLKTQSSVVSDTPLVIDAESYLDTEEKEWGKIKNSHHIKDYQDFLFLYPNGNYAKTAQQHLERLQQEITNNTEQNLATSCPFCGIWVSEDNTLKLRLVAAGKAMREQRFPDKKITCVSVFDKWSNTVQTMIFQEGETVCSDRSSITPPNELYFFRIYGKNKFVLEGEQKITYFRNDQEVVKPIELTPVPLLCVSERCIRQGYKNCELWETKFQCIEYLLKGTDCDSLGKGWKQLIFPKSNPETIEACQRICQDGAKKGNDKTTQVTCLSQ